MARRRRLRPRRQNLTHQVLSFFGNECWTMLDHDSTWKRYETLTPPRWEPMQAPERIGVFWVQTSVSKNNKNIWIEFISQNIRIQHHKSWQAVYMLARKGSFPGSGEKCHQTKTWQWVQCPNPEPGSCVGFPLGTASEAPVGLAPSTCMPEVQKQTESQPRDLSWL